MPKKSSVIDTDTVRHVSALARLELSEKEVAKFTADLNGILSAFKDLDKANPTCQPSFHPLPMKDVVREDKPDAPLPNDKALANTKHKEKGFFKGPKAI